MNICFLYGKIISEIQFNFLYHHKKHISIVEFTLETRNEFQTTILSLFAFDEIADKVYAEYEKNDFIKIMGKIENNKIRILEKEK